jgi:hypothetical protein
MKSPVIDNCFYFEKDGKKFGFEFYFDGNMWDGIKMDIDTFCKMAKNFMSKKEINEVIEEYAILNIETEARHFFRSEDDEEFDEKYFYSLYHDNPKKINNLKEWMAEWKPYLNKSKTIEKIYNDVQLFLQKLESGELKEKYKPVERVKGQTKKKTGSNGYVYLVYSCGLYKIGKSKDQYSRTTLFSTIMPVEVKLIHSFHSEDYAGAESTLHKRYAENRKMGEWFKLNEDQIKEICLIKDDEL